MTEDDILGRPSPGEEKALSCFLCHFLPHLMQCACVQFKPMLNLSRQGPSDKTFCRKAFFIQGSASLTDQDA